MRKEPLCDNCHELPAVIRLTIDGSPQVVCRHCGKVLLKAALKKGGVIKGENLEAEREAREIAFLKKQRGGGGS